MAKKKTVATPSGKKKGAGRASSTSGAKKPGASWSADQIGETAGQVWHLLAEGEPLTPTTLKRRVDAPGDVVMAAVGWLAREGKLAFITTGRTIRISLA